MKPKEILLELQKLTSQKEILLTPTFEGFTEFKYEPINHYIKSLQHFSKPETATAELFSNLIKDVLQKEIYPEVRIEEGFIDYFLKETNGNPILVELKPLFKLDKVKGKIKQESIDTFLHIQQVIKYLKTNEFVILTNLNEAFLYNRAAIVDEKPFATLTFNELLNRFFDFNNLTDTLRRFDDDSIKFDLDRQFFENLKNWYAEFKKVDLIENAKFTHDELIVLFLNKIIFIKTLEDYGLVEFKFLENEYLRQRERWKPKGLLLVFKNFFEDIESYFDVFYDTELFSNKFWDYVVKTESNLKVLQLAFERTLGLEAWAKAFGWGMLHYNYRQIDEDIFGKAYETFIAENKKDSGIYYTPKSITEFMAYTLCQQLFEKTFVKIISEIENGDYRAAGKYLEEFKNIKVIDTASGSGSFLIKVLRYIFRYYKEIDERFDFLKNFKADDLFHLPPAIKNAKVFREKFNFDNQLKLISEIILNHIYAIDIDERALETAKTNIWKEAVKLKPSIYSATKQIESSTHILPNLEINFINGDSLGDIQIDKVIDILGSEYKKELILLHEIRNRYLENSFNPEVISELIEIKNKIRSKLKILLPEVANPVFIALEYFHSYFDSEGIPLNKEVRGFHGIISNPPWETIKPIAKEFANQKKQQMEITSFNEWFIEKIENNEEFREEWEAYKEFYEIYCKQFLKNRYSYQSTGDPNYFKVFIERDLEILRKGGVLNILVPSSFQTDEGCDELRKLALNEYTFTDLLSFENRGYEKIINGVRKTIKLFPDVDNRFKFSNLNIVKDKNLDKNKTFNAKFYMLNPTELKDKKAIKYSIDMIKSFSPVNYSIMEFRNIIDYELCSKIRGKHELFGKQKLQLATEFHMTNDSSLFTNSLKYQKLNNTSDFAILYEGKMIHQFNSQFSSEINYFINVSSGRLPLERIELNKLKRKYKLNDEVVKKIKLKLDYEDYRLVYRAIGSSTNERSIISTIVPPNVFIGHSMNYLVNFEYEWEDKKVKHIQIDKTDLVYVMAMFNSLTLNYYIRNKISANLTMNFMYELPFPSVSQKQKDKIVKFGLTLLYNKSNKKLYKKLIEEIGMDIQEENDITNIRAELEVCIAKELFNLSKTDWEYLTSTFTFGNDSPTKKELDEIVKYSKEIY